MLRHALHSQVKSVFGALLLRTSALCKAHEVSVLLIWRLQQIPECLHHMLIAAVALQQMSHHSQGLHAIATLLKHRSSM